MICIKGGCRQDVAGTSWLHCEDHRGQRTPVVVICRAKRQVGDSRRCTNFVIAGTERCGRHQREEARK